MFLKNNLPTKTTIFRNDAGPMLQVESHNLIMQKCFLEILLYRLLLPFFLLDNVSPINIYESFFQIETTYLFEIL